VKTNKYLIRYLNGIIDGYNKGGIKINKCKVKFLNRKVKTRKITLEIEYK
jgi:hypothetical protein